MAFRITAKRLLPYIAVASMTMALPSHAEVPYTVKDGTALDANSFQGYKMYRQWCARCHGSFGQGGPNAPDLSESLSNISYDEYIEVVKTGVISSRESTNTSNNRMPAWQRNPNVMRNIDNIYSYLKARADNAIGVVTPTLNR